MPEEAETTEHNPGIHVILCSYDQVGGRTSHVLGVYTDHEHAELVAKKFVDLAETDEEPINRKTVVSPHYLNSDWYERFWGPDSENQEPKEQA